MLSGCNNGILVYQCDIYKTLSQIPFNLNFICSDYPACCLRERSAIKSLWESDMHEEIIPEYIFLLINVFVI